MTAKAKAHGEKSNDKNKASNTQAVWTMDLQAVLLCPSAKASTLYYKAKLPQHNVLAVGTKQAFNYKYDEKQVNLSSSMFVCLH